MNETGVIDPSHLHAFRTHLDRASKGIGRLGDKAKTRYDRQRQRLERLERELVRREENKREQERRRQSGTAILRQPLENLTDRLFQVLPAVDEWAGPHQVSFHIWGLGDGLLFAASIIIRDPVSQQILKVLYDLDEPDIEGLNSLRPQIMKREIFINFERTMTRGEILALLRLHLFCAPLPAGLDAEPDSGLGVSRSPETSSGLYTERWDLEKFSSPGLFSVVLTLSRLADQVARARVQMTPDAVMIFTCNDLESYESHQQFGMEAAVRAFVMGYYLARAVGWTPKHAGLYYYWGNDDYYYESRAEARQEIADQLIDRLGFDEDFQPFKDFAPTRAAAMSYPRFFDDIVKTKWVEWFYINRGIDTFDRNSELSALNQQFQRNFTRTTRLLKLQGVPIKEDVLPVGGPIAWSDSVSEHRDSAAAPPAGTASSSVGPVPARKEQESGTAPASILSRIFKSEIPSEPSAWWPLIKRLLAMYIEAFPKRDSDAHHSELAVWLRTQLMKTIEQALVAGEVLLGPMGDRESLKQGDLFYLPAKAPGKGRIAIFKEKYWTDAGGGDWMYSFLTITKAGMGEHNTDDGHYGPRLEEDIGFRLLPRESSGQSTINGPILPYVRPPSSQQELLRAA